MSSSSMSGIEPPPFTTTTSTTTTTTVGTIKGVFTAGETTKTVTDVTTSHSSKLDKAIRWVLAIFTIISLAFAIIGALVYAGKLQLGLTNVGMMSVSDGLYTLLGGGAATAVLAVILSSTICCKNSTKEPHTPLTPLPRAGAGVGGLEETGGAGDPSHKRASK